jgi:hypothetical protein
MEERFWEKVSKDGHGGCWRWLGGTCGRGYGNFYTHVDYVDGKRVVLFNRAHRVAYELLVGPIPSGLCIDHLCRNIWCVNPAHLEPVTTQVNNIRGIRYRAAA